MVGRRGRRVRDELLILDGDLFASVRRRATRQASVIALAGATLVDLGSIAAGALRTRFGVGVGG